MESRKKKKAPEIECLVKALCCWVCPKAEAEVRSIFSYLLPQGKGSGSTGKMIPHGTQWKSSDKVSSCSSHTRDRQERKQTHIPGWPQEPKWDSSKAIAWAAFPDYRHKHGIRLSYPNMNTNEEPPREASKMKRDSLCNWHKKNKRQRIN